jgi:formate dehydrogenase iron-sulfur subunit
VKQRIPMASRLHGRLDDVSGEAGYPEHPPRVGFFTDTSVCIGCKACEVACKEWNALPDPEAGVLKLSGESYDNTGSLGSNSWRHVAFIEQGPLEVGAPIPADGFPAAGPRGGGRAAGPRHPLADGLGRVQALHPRGLPGRVPDRRAAAHRVRHRDRAV